MSETVVRVLKITALCIVALLIVAALLYYVPWATPVDLTLNATKLDEAGNVLGTEEIHIKGHRLDYLFRDSRLAVEIEPFGSLKWVKLDDHSNGTGTIDRSYVDELDFEYFSVGFYGWDKDVGDAALCELFFTAEFDRMAIMYHPWFGDTFYYVASVSGDYSIQEIVEHFHGIAPTPK